MPRCLKASANAESGSKSDAADAPDKEMDAAAQTRATANSEEKSARGMCFMGFLASGDRSTIYGGRHVRNGRHSHMETIPKRRRKRGDLV